MGKRCRWGRWVSSRRGWRGRRGGWGSIFRGGFRGRWGRRGRGLGGGRGAGSAWSRDRGVRRRGREGWDGGDEVGAALFAAGSTKETFLVDGSFGSGFSFAGALSGGCCSDFGASQSTSLLPSSIFALDRSFWIKLGGRLSSSSLCSSSISSCDMFASFCLFSSSICLFSSSLSPPAFCVCAGPPCIPPGRCVDTGAFALAFASPFAALSFLNADTLGVRFLCAGNPPTVPLNDGATGGCGAPPVGRSRMSPTKADASDGVGAGAGAGASLLSGAAGSIFPLSKSK